MDQQCTNKIDERITNLANKLQAYKHIDLKII